MPYSPGRASSAGERAIEEFIKDLEATSEQVQKLLETVRNSELDFAAIKTELRILCENVKDISSLLRDGDGKVSLVTRVVLLEQKIYNLERDIDRKDSHNKTAQQSLADIVVADKTGKWQMRTALATGIIGLLASAITIIVQMLK